MSPLFACRTSKYFWSAAGPLIGCKPIRRISTQSAVLLHSPNSATNGSNNNSSSSQPPLIENLTRSNWASNRLKIENEERHQELLDIVNSFDAPIKFAFAYGSGVKPQVGYDNKSEPMIDFIFGVTHPEHWHSINIRQHKDHYSWLASLGSGTVAAVQKSGSGVYFNTLVPMNGKIIKYGVITLDHLIIELQEWNDLYISGRLQKPVSFLRDDARVYLANIVNRLNAIRIALLLLPEHFSEEELFRTIAGISYTGDTRMAFGENPKKVENIVSKQLPEFQIVYKRLLSSTKEVVLTGPGMYKQDIGPEARFHHLNQLPSRLQQLIINTHTSEVLYPGVDTVKEKRKILEDIGRSPNCAHYVTTGLSTIISASSSIQTFKGFLSAGMNKSARYAYQKVKKRFQ